MTAPTPPRIAFFDMDLTLIGVNSASGWVKRELRLGFISRWTAIRAAGWIGLYQLGFARMDDIVRGAIAQLEGDVEAVVSARTHDFWREEVVHTIRPGARAAIAAHRAQGDRLVLLTSSSNYMSDACQAELGLDAVLCNRFEVVDGRFTGKPIEPLCFGPGKVAHARRFAETHGVALSDCSFYTDSFSDLPVMEVVGEPVAVHPDPRLRREARRRGWRIEHWG